MFIVQLLTRHSLRIQVSRAGSESKYTPEPKGAIDLKNADVCLKVCWPDKPQCPEGWVSKTQLMVFATSLTCTIERKEICTVLKV